MALIKQEEQNSPETVKAKIAVFGLGPDGNRPRPALVTSDLYEEMEEHETFLCWAHVDYSFKDREILIQLPEISPNEEEMFDPPKTYA